MTSAVAAKKKPPLQKATEPNGDSAVAASASRKLLGLQGLDSLRKKFQNKTIGLCHGAFDAIHIGHIEHLEEAKGQCDILVVSLTGDRFITKHPRGVYHSAAQRAQMMGSLLSVDYVYIDNNAEAIEVLDTLKPDFYFKGVDYDKQIEHNPALKREADACAAGGGRIVFTQTRKHSSSYLLNNFLDEKRIMIGAYLKKYGISSDNTYLEHIYGALAKADILLLGEAIIDIYSFGALTGVSSKYTAPSFLESSSKTMAGGTLVLIPLLTSYVKHLSAVVPEDCDTVATYAERDNVTLKKNAFPMVEKTRYISAKKKERLFETVRFVNGKNFALAEPLDALIRQKDYSAVLIYDFGHGFFDGTSLMTSYPDRFYAINVQANSTNYPFNDVQKYKNYSLVTVDERELRLTMRDNSSDVEALINRFIEQSPVAESAAFFFTLGERGAWAYRKGERIFCPALVSSVVDATGSGDVFHAIATLFIVSNLDLGTTLFFASLYAGLYAQIEGHDGHLAKAQIIRSIAAMQ